MAESKVGSSWCALCGSEVPAGVCPTHGLPTAPRRLEPVQPCERGALLQGRYRLGDLIGEGGMGRVFLAEQLSVQREVAVKVARLVASDLRRLASLRDEALAVSRIQSPYVVRVLDFGHDTDRGVFFVVFERLVGRTLAEALAGERSMPVSRALAIVAQMALGLEAVHAAKLVHGDLKPQNVLLARQGGGQVVKIIDFGASFATSEDRSASGARGTPLYRAPEQVSGERSGPAADLYSLGVVLHELLTGCPPFVAGSRADLDRLHALAVAPPLPPQLPTGEAPSLALVQLHRRLLAKDPAARPTSSLAARVAASLSLGAVEEALAQLESLQAESPDSRLLDTTEHGDSRAPPIAPEVIPPESSPEVVSATPAGGAPERSVSGGPRPAWRRVSVAAAVVTLTALAFLAGQRSIDEMATPPVPAPAAPPVAAPQATARPPSPRTDQALATDGVGALPGLADRRPGALGAPKANVLVPVTPPVAPPSPRDATEWVAPPASHADLEVVTSPESAPTAARPTLRRPRSVRSKAALPTPVPW